MSTVSLLNTLFYAVELCIFELQMSNYFCMSFVQLGYFQWQSSFICIMAIQFCIPSNCFTQSYRCVHPLQFLIIFPISSRIYYYVLLFLCLCVFIANKPVTVFISCWWLQAIETTHWHKTHTVERLRFALILKPHPCTGMWL